VRSGDEFAMGGGRWRAWSYRLEGLEEEAYGSKGAEVGE
jgi:hypothetical protein